MICDSEGIVSVAVDQLDDIASLEILEYLAGVPPVLHVSIASRHSTPEPGSLYTSSQSRYYNWVYQFL